MGNEKLVQLLHEVGLLRRTPRSGWQTIGAPYESVAEHSFRTAVIGYALAKMEKLGKEEERKVVLSCLFHDVAEARCGDLNLMNKKYVHAHHRKALEDALRESGLEEILELPIDKEGSGKVALILNDADLLDVMFSAKEYLDEGNKYAQKWLANSLPMLKTKSGKGIAKKMLSVDSKDWLFKTDLFRKENRKK